MIRCLGCWDALRDAFSRCMVHHTAFPLSFSIAAAPTSPLLPCGNLTSNTPAASSMLHTPPPGTSPCHHRTRHPRLLHPPLHHSTTQPWPPLFTMPTTIQVTMINRILAVMWPHVTKAVLREVLKQVGPILEKQVFSKVRAGTGCLGALCFLLPCSCHLLAVRCAASGLHCTYGSV